MALSDISWGTLQLSEFCEQYLQDTRVTTSCWLSKAGCCSSLELSSLGNLQVQHPPEVLFIDIFVQVPRQTSPRFAALTLNPYAAVLALSVCARLLHHLWASLRLQAVLYDRLVS